MPPPYTDELIDDLEQLEHVISLSVVRGASVKPEGDLLMMNVLTRGADEVLRLAADARNRGQVSVSTGELTSIIDPEHEQKVANDVDEALWEEAETGFAPPEPNSGKLPSLDGPRRRGRRWRPVNRR